MRKVLLAVLLLTVTLWVTNRVIVHLVREKIYARKLTFVDSTPLEALRQVKAESEPIDPKRADLETTRPFDEIDALDEDAKDWSNQFSQYGGAGALAFDANGDGRLDLYFVQDGQNWTRPTDENAVLMDEPRYQHNALYINQGNDEDGKPLFKQIKHLVRANDTYVAEELLVEDYLFPRTSADDDEKRWGRGSNVAVAADFNNDGRMDLLVGNEPQGMFWSHEKTQRVLMQFVNPVGREAKKSKQPLAAMGLHLVDYTPRHSLEDKRQSARVDEFEGANSLYLNMGDRDGDGLPEWQDASRATGIEGFRPTYSLSVGDIDLDGDLDVFVGNTCDMDYWIGGSKYWAGGANELYINQLAETGELNFVERAAEMNVDGVYDEDYPMPDYYKLRRIPFLPAEYSIWFMKYEAYQPDFLEINGQEGERGQISWAAVFQDVNEDGWPDVWVANDMGFLRLYVNKEGKNFELTDHARARRSGYWMTFTPGDFNGDLKEDLFVGNLGGGVMNHAFATPDPYDLFDPVILNATIFGQFFNDKHDTRHGFIDGADISRELNNKAYHSKVLPPDVTFSNNYRRHAPEGLDLPDFDPDTINAYEFSWGGMSMDIQNDGRPDIYYVGCLYGRGGGLFPISGTGPGRLLVNVTSDTDTARFADLTAEHHMFNIQELKYDRLESEGYIYRKAPSQNWRKRDMCYSYDRGSWALQGPGIQEKITNQDMIQAAENGRSVVAADLNGDGYSDIIVRNKGGYDSRSSKAKNLKVRIDGRAQVLPPHNNNYPSPTNYEPGSTRLFINNYAANNWLKIRLVDDSPDSYNRNAVGARVIVNGKHLLVNRVGNGGFLSNKTEALIFGLGKDVGKTIEIHWPDKKRKVTKHQLDGVFNRTITVSKTGGLHHES
ncbi:MAG: FG-GAP-like repeat-containing protein [Acidobacteriota bacterium]|nr:FG-GAP-like repeat-containing protein [Acidobacteriota bacterium]